MDKLRIEEINREIIRLKKERDIVKRNLLLKKRRVKKDKKENGISNGNEIIRVSKGFAKKLSDLNDKREENGFEGLSNPKITDLIIKHKIGWVLIERDIINFVNDKEGEKIYV